jgi:hypothetical protein
VRDQITDKKLNLVQILPLAGVCELSNETPVFIKARNFLNRKRILISQKDFSTDLVHIITIRTSETEPYFSEFLIMFRFK